jgi:hypothetical protein
MNVSLHARTCSLGEVDEIPIHIKYFKVFKILKEMVARKRLLVF